MDSRRTGHRQAPTADYEPTLIDRAFSRLGRLILFSGSVGAGSARGPLGFWLLWQRITDLYYRAKPVRPGGLTNYAINRYHGEPITLADGTEIRRGDLIGELHVDNRALVKRLLAADESQRATGWAWLVHVQAIDDLRVLAVPGRLPSEVKALHAITLLGHVGRRMGFEVATLPKTRRNDLTAFFMVGLLAIYHPEGQRYLAKRRISLYPAEIWFGRQRLVDRYGPADSPDASGGMRNV